MPIVVEAFSKATVRGRGVLLSLPPGEKLCWIMANMDAHHDGFEPAASLASCRREFGEYGGVNASVESSTTFTVLEAKSMPEIFSGQKNPDNGELC